MRKRSLWRYTKSALMAVFIVAAAATGTAYATTPTSNHYQLTDSQFGAGTLNGCSSKYCATVSIGDTAVGDSKTGASTAKFGSLTSGEPDLSVIVDPGQSNLGTLDTEHTGSKTMVVKVRTYLSNGYMLQITGTPPKYSGHTLATPSSPTASTPGKEQFAINAATNTTPNIGADPVQVPDSSTSFGVVNDNYKIPDLFMYHSGDVIAHSDKDSGETDYTISMIVNISNTTPAGHYSGDFSAVAIPSF